MVITFQYMVVVYFGLCVVPVVDDSITLSLYLLLINLSYNKNELAVGPTHKTLYPGPRHVTHLETFCIRFIFHFQVVDRSKQWWIVRNNLQEEGHVPQNVLEPMNESVPMDNPQVNVTDCYLCSTSSLLLTLHYRSLYPW